MKQMKKVYIEVIAHTDETGFMVPLSIRLPNGKQYNVDSLLDYRGAGEDLTRYVVEIMGRRLQLYFQKNPPIMFPQVGRWYLVKY